jgi:hypothetical protein
MPHPIFESLDDPLMADACSEVFTTGRHAVFSTGEVMRRLENPTSIQEFVKKGWMDLVSVQAVYLENHPSGGLRDVNKTEVIDTGIGLSAVPEIMDLYRDSVGKWQEHRQLLIVLGRYITEGAALDGMDALQEWCVDTCVDNNIRLLAAHIVSRATSNGALIDAVVAPEAFTEDLPFIWRNLTLELLGIDEASREGLQPILRQEEPIKHIGTMAASTFLATAEVFEATLMMKLAKGTTN